MLHLFTDPLFRAPFLGSMLMCLTSALVGTYLLVRHRTLLGEALSHAAYPGVVLSLLIGSFFFLSSDSRLILIIVAGAFVFSYLGMITIETLHMRYAIHLDSVMCLVLSLFLGLGVVIGSRMQFTHPLWYQQAQLFLYGQAATMTDKHIVIYAILSLYTLSFVIFRFRQIELVAFDRTFARSLGLALHKIDFSLMTLVILAIITGIRSAGVMMMTGMLIAPAISARAFTNRYSHIMLLSSFFGVLSGFGGTYLSILFSQKGFSLPTGPMILLFSVVIALFSLLFAPKNGVVACFIRSFRFRKRCHFENILKTLWKHSAGTPMSYQMILHWNPMLHIRLWISLFFLQKEGWIFKVANGFLLTSDGIKRASHIVRLHRLWELYLTTCLDIDEKRVHHCAEEMEHIITPELEKRLTLLLNDPKNDPHHKPIPMGEV